MVRAVQTTLRGLGAALRARPGTVLALVVAVFAVHVLLPPLILALARKPWTYFAFNPWLSQLPDYLASSAPLRQKLDFLSRLAVFWFTADGAYGFPEWGFAVDTMDLARFLATSLLIAAYAARGHTASGATGPSPLRTSGTSSRRRCRPAGAARGRRTAGIWRRPSRAG